jgi:hypothetical protein
MASSTYLEVPEDGAAFESWVDLRKALSNWAIRDKFTFRTPKKTCNWRVCARKSEADGGLLVIAIKQSEHNCLGCGVPKKAVATNSDWLDDVIIQNLNITKVTKPREIQECIRVRFGEDISYRVAHLCRQRLLNEDIGTHRHSFHLLPAYRDLLQEKSPGVYIDLQILAETSKPLILLSSTY